MDYPIQCNKDISKMIYQEGAQIDIVSLGSSVFPFTLGGTF